MREVLNIDSIICQNKEIDTADLNEDKVMMNLDKGYYFALNTIGSRIWDMVEKPKKIKDLLEQIIEQYDVNYDICKEAVLKFLEELIIADLIEVK